MHYSVNTFIGSMGVFWGDNGVCIRFPARVEIGNFA